MMQHATLPLMSDSTLNLMMFWSVILLLTIIFARLEKLMSDLSKLTASVSTLSGKVDQLIAAGSSDQPAIDAVTAEVDALSTKIDAALPAAPTA